jgi:hypothetical protein
MSNQSALQPLTKQRDEWMTARKIAMGRFDSEDMEKPGFIESNLQQIASLDTLLANIEKVIAAYEAGQHQD